MGARGCSGETARGGLKYRRAESVSYGRGALIIPYYTSCSYLMLPRVYFRCSASFFLPLSLSLCLFLFFFFNWLLFIFFLFSKIFGALWEGLWLFFKASSFKESGKKIARWEPHSGEVQTSSRDTPCRWTLLLQASQIMLTEPQSPLVQSLIPWASLRISKEAPRIP